MMTVGGMRMVAPQQEASEEGVRGWRMAGTKVEVLHLEERVEGLVVGEEEEAGEDGVDEVVGGEEVVLEGNHQKMEVRKRGQVAVLAGVVAVSDEDGTEITTKMVVVLVDVVAVSDEDGTEMTTKMVVVLVDVVAVLDEDGMERTAKMVVVVLVDVVVEGEVVLGENFQKKMEVRKRGQVVVVLVDVAVAEEGSGEAAEGIVKVTMRMERKLKVGTDSVGS